MTAPAFQQGDALQVELAQLGGVDLKSSTQLVAYVSMLGTFLTGTFGHDWGVAKNAQIIAYVAFALIAVAHLISRSIHHSAVEKANGGVKEAMIYAATSNRGTVVATSPEQLVGGTASDASVATVDPLPVNDTPPPVAPDTSGIPVVDATGTPPTVVAQ